MPFPKGKSGNPKGRPTGDQLINPKSLSKTEVRDKELKQILRRLKPLTTKATMKLADMLESDTTTEAGKIKVSVFLIKTYQDIINDVYEVEGSNSSNTDEDEEVTKSTPIIQFNRA